MKSKTSLLVLILISSFAQAQYGGRGGTGGGDDDGQEALANTPRFFRNTLGVTTPLDLWIQRCCVEKSNQCDISWIASADHAVQQYIRNNCHSR